MPFWRGFLRCAQPVGAPRTLPRSVSRLRISVIADLKDSYEGLRDPSRQRSPDCHPPSLSSSSKPKLRKPETAGWQYASRIASRRSESSCRTQGGSAEFSGYGLCPNVSKSGRVRRLEREASPRSKTNPAGSWREAVELMTLIGPGRVVQHVVATSEQRGIQRSRRHPVASRPASWPRSRSRRLGRAECAARLRAGRRSTGCVHAAWWVRTAQRCKPRGRCGR
jgi:hypothetical protein